MTVVARRADRGASAVEYGLLVGLIAVVIIGAVLILGTQLDALFTSITETLEGPSGVDGAGG
ncbi:Flp family type IVb pilin [Isoptericola sediminis]|nr:Flp family type IVb pilin [Isoptericola sediminis]